LKNASRFSKLPKLGDLVAEIDRLDGEASKAIRVPGQGASDEEVRKYREALGIPQSPEGYRLTRPNLPQGMQYSEDLEKWFRSEFHRANVPEAVAQAIFNDWNKLQTDRYNSVQAAVKKSYEDGKAALQQQWGDRYEEEMALNAKAYSAYLTPTLLQKIRARGLDNDPEFIMAWNKIGHSIGEDKMIVATTGGASESPGNLPRTKHGHTLEFPNMRTGAAPGLKFPVRRE
jgi:hypothetical protein